MPTDSSQLPRPNPPPALGGPVPARASHPPASRPAAARRPLPSRRTPLTDAERAALIEAEQARAHGLCEQALAQTPEPYRSFVILIAQRKNLGGRDDPVWAAIQLPYMTVDGRVRMARDEHKAAGKQIHIPAESTFVEEPVTQQLLAKVAVRSELYGSAVAHARVFLSGGGPHETNPLETAETSAVGRALGFLGYGCFGTGIASADEVLRALKTPESAGLPAGASVNPSAGAAAGSGAPARPAPPASPHAEEIERLAKAASLRPGELDLLRARAPDEAALLACLRERARPATATPAGSPPPGSGNGDQPRHQRGDFLRLANELDVPTMAYLAFLRKEYGVGHPGDLTDGHAARESDRFVLRKSDPRSAKKFRGVCQRLVSPTQPALPRAPNGGAP